MSTYNTKEERDSLEEFQAKLSEYKTKIAFERRKTEELKAANDKLIKEFSAKVAEVISSGEIKIRTYVSEALRDGSKDAMELAKQLASVVVSDTHQTLDSLAMAYRIDIDAQIYYSLDNLFESMAATTVTEPQEQDRVSLSRLVFISLGWLLALSPWIMVFWAMFND